MNQQDHLPPAQVRAFAEIGARLAGNVSTVVLGKPEVVRLAVTALLSEGHILLEDVPGVGKTTLARAVAASVRGQWRRVQFTPDLLPADVTGVTIFNQGTGGFEFHPGPVFANIVIADEINRASPKTQSSLLEVMEERYVTVDGVRHAVPRPFLVVATQNPVEMDGTYRLPEAQLDRFLMKLSVGYPDEAVEIEVLRGAAGRSPDNLLAITDTNAVGEMIRFARGVRIADPLYAYAVRLAAATRTHPQVRLGVSPRGVIALTRAAGVYALLNGRGFVLPEDVKALTGPVFAHRILLSADAQLRGLTPADVLHDALTSVPVPQPAGAALPRQQTPSSSAGYTRQPAGDTGGYRPPDNPTYPPQPAGGTGGYRPPDNPTHTTPTSTSGTENRPTDTTGNPTYPPQPASGSNEYRPTAAPGGPILAPPATTSGTEYRPPDTTGNPTYPPRPANGDGGYRPPGAGGASGYPPPADGAGAGYRPVSDPGRFAQPPTDAPATGRLLPVNGAPAAAPTGSDRSAVRDPGGYPLASVDRPGGPDGSAPPGLP